MIKDLAECAKRIPPGPSFWYVRSVVAAAAEHQNQGKNDDPGAAIVKDVAKAVVVIHRTVFLLKDRRQRLRYHSMRGALNGAGAAGEGYRLFFSKTEKDSFLWLPKQKKLPKGSFFVG